MFLRRAWLPFVFSVVSFLSSSVSAAVLFSNPLADGSRPNPVGSSGYELNYNLTGNCWSSGCTIYSGMPPSNAYAADNFGLASASTLTTLKFTGIRTGQTRFDDVVGVVNWRIYRDDNTYANGPTASQLGALVANGGSSITNGAGKEVNGKYFREYEVDLDALSLGAGSYFFALHLDIVGDNHQADDTTVYLANGYGDGVWARNIVRWTDSGPEANIDTGWINPNSDLLQGGLAMSIEGTSVDVPEPSSAALIFMGGAAMLWRRRKQPLRPN